MTGLDALVVVDRAAFRVEVALTAAPGEVVALLGPNGAGKSTVLGALAGVETLAAGHIRLREAVLDDVARGVHRDLGARDLGWVPQDPLLFPHLTVRENVAFGLRARGVARVAARRTADEWLEQLGIGALGQVRPDRISGGQAQRVALARALAPEPLLLLLDEPLGALDVEVREEVRADLAGRLRLHRGSTVLVTHDPRDAAVLADAIVVIERGRVVQRGTAEELRRNPASPYVAAMFLPPPDPRQMSID
jgi:molybdate transport system ATP-binding protein